MADFETQRHRERRDGKHSELTGQIIRAAIEVHRFLGPGLLESVYHACLAHEFSLNGLAFESEKPVHIRYKGVVLTTELRADFIVAGSVVVEIKVVEQVPPIHRAQLLTYMRLTGCEVGLLINFFSQQLTKGVERFAL